MNFGILCISSINNTSPGSKLDKTAAKSPLFSIAGPLVVFIFVPSSFAIINDSVVFPSPGGPYSNTWSSASSLIFAAFINMFRFSFISVCPTYSSIDVGLIACSKDSSLSLICNFSCIVYLL